MTKDINQIIITPDKINKYYEVEKKYNNYFNDKIETTKFDYDTLNIFDISKYQFYTDSTSLRESLEILDNTSAISKYFSYTDSTYLSKLLDILDNNNNYDIKLLNLTKLFLEYDKKVKDVENVLYILKNNEITKAEKDEKINNLISSLKDLPEHNPYKYPKYTNAYPFRFINDKITKVLDIYYENIEKKNKILKKELVVSDINENIVTDMRINYKKQVYEYLHKYKIMEDINKYFANFETVNK